MHIGIPRAARRAQALRPRSRRTAASGHEVAPPLRPPRTRTYECERPRDVQLHLIVERRADAHECGDHCAAGHHEHLCLDVLREAREGADGLRAPAQ